MAIVLTNTKYHIHNHDFNWIQFQFEFCCTNHMIYDLKSNGKVVNGKHFAGNIENEETG